MSDVTYQSVSSSQADPVLVKNWPHFLQFFPSSGRADRGTASRCGDWGRTGGVNNSSWPGQCSPSQCWLQQLIRPCRSLPVIYSLDRAGHTWLDILGTTEEFPPPTNFQPDQLTYISSVAVQSKCTCPVGFHYWECKKNGWWWRISTNGWGYHYEGNAA